MTAAAATKNLRNKKEPASTQRGLTTTPPPPPHGPAEAGSDQVVHILDGGQHFKTQGDGVRWLMVWTD